MGGTVADARTQLRQLQKEHDNNVCSDCETRNPQVGQRRTGREMGCGKERKRGRASLAIESSAAAIVVYDDDDDVFVVVVVVAAAAAAAAASAASAASAAASAFVLSPPFRSGPRFPTAAFSAWNAAAYTALWACICLSSDR